MKRLLEAESENLKLKDELISLREEMKKMKKVDDNLVSLKENILEQQEKLNDVKAGMFHRGPKDGRKSESSGQAS